MKLHLLSFIFFLLPLSFIALNAQPGMQDAVYLKNGSIMKGVIIEHIIGSQVKILTYGGSIFCFQYSEIEKMVKEDIPENNMTDKPDRAIYEPKEKGITGNFAVGLNTGEDIGISLLMNMMYLMNYHYSLGIGMGVESFNRSYFPIFLNFQYRPLKGLAGPFFYSMGGYSAPGTDNNRDYNGGILAEGGMGFRFHGSSRTRFQISVGFRYQESSFDYSYNYWQEGYQRVSGKDYFRRIPVRFGFTIE